MSNNLKICIQKFLPEHRHIMSDINNSSKLAAAFYTKKIWPSQTEIFVVFMRFIHDSHKIINARPGIIQGVKCVLLVSLFMFFFKTSI